MLFHPYLLTFPFFFLFFCRYFEGVQGRSRQKGELFGLENLLDVHLTSVSRDAILRTDRVEAAYRARAAAAPAISGAQTDAELAETIMVVEKESEAVHACTKKG